MPRGNAVRPTKSTEGCRLRLRYVQAVTGGAAQNRVQRPLARAIIISMRRVLLTIVALLAGLMVATTSAATRTRPVLIVHGTRPIVLLGRHFVAHERVTITSNTGKSVRVTANSTGAFSVTLGNISPDRCAGLRLRAVGSQGSIATIKLPLPACRIQRSPRAIVGRL